MESVNKKGVIGIIGLAVMGANLARNFERNGYRVVVYNRTTSVTDEFINSFQSGQPKADVSQSGGGFLQANTLEELVALLERPRKILLIVKAGVAVDQTITALLPLLERGDLIMDGGNSHYNDTERRVKLCEEHDVGFLGVGISGGEEGALWGPSIMPGGTFASWQAVAPLLESVAARADGKPCVTYVGPQGSGHFVKMVHNGIEYADMQLIAESYDILRKLCGLSPEDLAQLYEQWNEGPLQSFLIEITARIFRKRDDLSGGYLIDQILDQAQQKGTGKWTAETALSEGVVVSVIDAAVMGRLVSSMQTKREICVDLFADCQEVVSCGDDGEVNELVTAMCDALLVAKIICYTQGMDLINEVSVSRDWQIVLSEVARIWKNGCIIRARLLDEIEKEFKPGGGLKENFLLTGSLGKVVREKIAGLRTIVSRAVMAGIPVPAFNNALAYFDALKSEKLPQNLIQAQRDLFGAHTYLRRDRSGVFHSQWE